MKTIRPTEVQPHRRCSTKAAKGLSALADSYFWKAIPEVVFGTFYQTWQQRSRENSTGEGTWKWIWQVTQPTRMNQWDTLHRSKFDFLTRWAPVDCCVAVHLSGQFAGFVPRVTAERHLYALSLVTWLLKILLQSCSCFPSVIEIVLLLRDVLDNSAPGGKTNDLNVIKCVLTRRWHRDE